MRGKRKREREKEREERRRERTRFSNEEIDGKANAEVLESINKHKDRHRD